jgi:hypothetical protein
MAAPSALVVWGGWKGHEPEQVAGLHAAALREKGFEVEVASTLDAFLDEAKLKCLALIVPLWTMGEIKKEQLKPVLAAVESGVGLAGCHGGMCDAFRLSTEWQFMTGGQWVAHPGGDGVRYTVHISRSNPHQITDGLPDFEVVSEQYYLHTDPTNNVLATTPFPTAGVDGPHVQNAGKMPQVWTKMYGKGKVFYTAIGHHRDNLETGTAREIARRGMLWAAK